MIPAFNEAASIGAVVTALRAAAAWHEIIVVDDGSSDDTGGGRRGGGRPVVRHPYNKGNGAAVKTGIRQATGDYVLIIDADGQHQPGRRHAAGRPPRRIRPRRRRARHRQPGDARAARSATRC